MEVFFPKTFFKQQPNLIRGQVSFAYFFLFLPLTECVDIVSGEAVYRACEGGYASPSRLCECRRGLALLPGSTR